MGYFGSMSHQPRLLSVAALCQAFGCFTMTLAHWTSADYQPHSQENAFSENLCSSGKYAVRNISRIVIKGCYQDSRDLDTGGIKV